MPDFKLSASLEGHGDDVRAVAFPNPNAILSASRDATVRVWKLASTPPPVYDYTISSHGSAFVNALTYFPPTPDFPEGLLISGGQDTIIEARQPGKSVDDNADAMLLGHRHNVCALDVCPEGGWIVSGSWDATARLWRVNKWECDATLEGHEGSVWAVLAYDKDTIITGGADKLIRIFNTSGTLVQTIKGSPDIVRSLCKLPSSHPSGAQFAAASNDGVIRMFKLDGQLVAELYGHESFIYCLASLPSGELVSSGEDRTVRVWNGAQCVQTITHPAISVWSVAVCKENGDIVTGASDRITRVFTRSPERQAAAEVVQQFEASVKESAIPEQQVGKVNKEQLPGPDFLQRKSGTKEGQVQMIREDDGSVTAHTWSGATQQWIAVGTVVDSAASGGRKTEYLGQDYDYVFDVDVEDGQPPLKLPYNVTQNPYEAATKFIADNELPKTYLEQVANFIVQNTQGATIGQTTQEPVGDAAQPSVPESRPKVLPQKTFLSIKTANLKVVSKKLQELNEQLLSSGSKDIALAPPEVETLSALCREMEKSPRLKDSPLVDNGASLLFKVATEWHPANRLPGLDLLRLLASATPMIATMDYGNQDLISGIRSGGIFDPPININNAMLTVRMMANLFETDAGRDLAMKNFDQILAMIQPVLDDSGGTPNRNFTIAVATLYINFAVFSTTEGRESAPESSERALALLEKLAKLLSDEKDSEAVYRCIVALGTLVKGLGEEVRSAAKEIYDVGAVLDKISSTGLGKEPRMKGVIDEVRESMP